MNWKKWTIISFIVAFVALNLFLILKKDSEISRAKYIDEWVSVKKQNLVQSRIKAGVVIPLEVEQVYFNGDFRQFFVKEGDEVQAGSPLFEYSPQDIEAEIRTYEAEVTKLKTERNAIAANIEQLEGLVAGIFNRSEDGDTVMASSIEAQIYEKELHINQIDAEIQKYQELIAIGDNNLYSLTVNSNISGIVKEINQNLQNPVVTISSNDQQVEGYFEEEEVLDIT